MDPEGKGTLGSRLDCHTAQSTAREQWAAPLDVLAVKGILLSYSFLVLAIPATCVRDSGARHVHYVRAWAWIRKEKVHWVAD